MATSTNTTVSGTAPTPKNVFVAEEKVNDKNKTIGESLDKAVRKSDEATAEVLESGIGGGGGEGSKRAVWNKTKNEGVEVVMGGDLWPALSDKVKAPLKSSVESSKNVREVVVPILQGITTDRSRKQVTTNPQPNFIQTNAHPARQKSFRRHGGSTSSNTSSPTHPLQSPPPFSQSQSNSAPSNQSATNAHKNVESPQKFISDPQSHGTGERPQHNNSQRKGAGPHQHGDGSYNHRYGARKDQDRHNRNWNNQGNNNGRDAYPQPMGDLPRGIIKHMPHNSGMYVAPPLSPPTVRPFGPPVSYPEFPFYYVLVPPPESIRGFTMPYSPTGPHQMFTQYIDPELYSKVVNQIEYYFSNENLVKDIYLRNNMDEEGWVSVELIAGFKQVKKLTNNIAFIMEAIQSSTVVEVKDDKVRRRIDWSKWLVPGSLKIPSPSSAYRDPGSSSPIAAGIQKLNINQGNADIPSASSPS